MTLPEWRFELLRPSDLARQLGVSRAWIYEAARTGRIPSVRIGGKGGPLRFVPEDVERWLDEARSKWKPGQLGSSTPSRVNARKPA
jgi:excisionase family DNA binding protein